MGRNLFSTAPSTATRTGRRYRGLTSAALLIAGAANAQTKPGTPITNTALVSYEIAGVARRVQSNTVTLLVTERLDVALERANDTVPQIADAPVAVPVVLTNTGSGEEAFTVVAASTPTASVSGVAVDRNGDGRLDGSSDQMLNGPTPVLAPGETLHLIAMVTPTGDNPPAAGEVTVTAKAVTGSGTADALFVGAGDGGADAVVGATGATASTDVPFQGASAVPDSPTLVKSQSVLAPDGSASAVSGAVVTYTLAARFPATPTRAARIDDPIPAGVSYLPGSLTLDGETLSDADDADPGAVANGAVSVRLGDMTAAAVRTVTFKIRLP